MESMVFCKDGHCRTVSPEEFLANTFSKEALIVEESLAARSHKKNKKSKKNRNKKSKNKKNNKVAAEPPLNLEDMLPKEGENTGNSKIKYLVEYRKKNRKNFEIPTYLYCE